MSDSEWVSNAKRRYAQVLSGQDVTFSNIFVPYLVE